MKTISIKQPWASLICTPRKDDSTKGIKDIENRTWPCPKKYIGQRVLVHASMCKTNGLIADYLSPEQYIQFHENVGYYGLDFLEPLGAIIGSVEIVGCVINHESIWAEKSDIGRCHDSQIIYNWVLANPILFPEPIPAKGNLSFWDYPNILAEPEEKGGRNYCHCQIPVKEENQVMPLDNGEYICRYCGSKWYK